MRRFVVLGHKAVTNQEFTLDDLCGSTGRLDVLLRSINSSLLLSHGIRRDAEIYLVLLGKPLAPRTIRVSGERVKYLNPDERSTGALVRQALSKSHLVPEDGGEVNSTPGIHISNRGLREVLDSFPPETKIFCLDEKGKDARSVDFPGDVAFILSDHKNFSEEEEKLLDDSSCGMVSLGPVVVHTHHAITLVQNELDRRD